MPIKNASFWLCVGLLLAVATGFFSPVLFGDRIFFPMHSAQLQPWRASAGEDVAESLDQKFNPALTDKNFLFHPDTEFMVSQWRNGELPLWNPYLLGGFNQLGQALFGAFYPCNLLYLLFASLEDSYVWLTILHIVIAGLGAYYYLRRIRLSDSAAVLGAVLFAFSGPLLVRYHYYMTFYPVAWTPWLFAFLHWYVRQPSLGAALFIPWPIALMILAGFPQTGFYGIYLGCGIAVIELFIRWRNRAWRPLLGLVAACALGGVLTSVQILPVFATQKHSLSRERSATEQIQNSGSYWLPSGYVVPAAFVDPRQDWSVSWFTNPLWAAVYAKSGRNDLGEPVPRSMTASPNVTEDSCYAGALGLLLLFAALCGPKTRLSWTLIGGLLVCWAYALGFQPLVWLAYHFLPGANIGDVRRILPTAAFLAAVLAAIGYDQLRFSKSGVRGALVLGALVLVALLAAATWLWQLGDQGFFDQLNQRIEQRFQQPLPLSEQQRATLPPKLHEFASSRLSRSALWMSGAFLVLLLLALCRGRWRRWALLAAILFSAFDLGSFHRRYNASVPGEGFLEDHPLIACLEKRQDEGRLHRFDRRSGTDLNTLTDPVLPINLAMHWRLHDTAGYIVAVPARFAAYLGAIQQPETIKTVIVMPLRDPDALDSNLLDEAAVRFLLTQEDLSAMPLARDRWQLIHQSGPNRVYENTAAQPFLQWKSEACAVPAGEANWNQILAELGRDLRPQERLYLEIDRAATLSALGLSATDAGIAFGNESVPLYRGSGTHPEIRATERSANRLTIELVPGNGGFLLWREGFDPGWRAAVDGKPVPVWPANVAFQAVHVPENTRRIEFHYSPQSFQLGSMLSVAGLLAWIGLAAFSWFRRRRSRQPASRQKSRPSRSEQM